MWSLPILCEHGGDAGLTREGLSRCPMCRAGQCGVETGRVHGRGRRATVQRCPLPRGHGHDIGQQPAVTPGVSAGRPWSPTAIVEQLDLDRED